MADTHHFRRGWSGKHKYHIMKKTQGSRCMIAQGFADTFHLLAGQVPSHLGVVLRFAFFENIGWPTPLTPLLALCVTCSSCASLQTLNFLLCVPHGHTLFGCSEAPPVPLARFIYCADPHTCWFQLQSAVRNLLWSLWWTEKRRGRLSRVFSQVVRCPT